MAVSPPTTSGFSNSSFALPARQKKAKADGAGDSPTSRAVEMNEETNRELTQAEQLRKEAARDAEASINQIRDDYDRQAEAELIRGQETIEHEKMKGYEALRQLQRQQQAELNRVKREGDTQLGKIKQYYKNATAYSEHSEKEKLTELRKAELQELQFQKKNSTDLAATYRAQQDDQLERLRSEGDRTIQALTQARQAELERLNASTTEARQKAESDFQNKFQGTLVEQQGTLQRLDQQAADKIQQVRQDNSNKLMGYSSRQEDPFYNLRTLESSLSDEGECYVFTARIPQYEQNHVSVAVRGDALEIGVARKNEEKLESTPGHVQTTASYQSTRESFPLDQPVDPKLLQRRFDGDLLVVSIPKKHGFRGPTQT